MKSAIKMIYPFVLAAMLLLALTACAEKAPQEITLKSNAFLLGAPGETLRLSDEIEGAQSAALTFAVSDASVAEVSDDGVLTAKDYGTTTLTVAAKKKPSVSASADVLVYPYQGVYTATKYIDAMGCDIRIRLSLHADGSYDYYRYPMLVALEGGGQMPSLSDQGTYDCNGSALNFTGEVLPAFSMTFQISESSAALSGSMPTGGANTQMQLLLNETADRGERGTYTGKGETETGESLVFTLKLNGGSYTLQANGKTVSEGSYSFENNSLEFSAENGASFTADYSAERAAVEGMQIPVSAASDEITTTVTLQREG